ncbi:MAG TPA: cobalamin B12-binding domain-containing protein [Candidatus Wunengus sp. YC60]|uniref:cobalamin B12-binding domain-containing protein n=1 Tax=Candidatus Wunengus sp. YC60 TaxID=3367697 RepID=UPI004027605E
MEVRQQRGRVLIGKLGLDGHDRGAKIIARSLCNDGFEVIYTGIRRTLEEIASAAIQEDVDAIGLSLLSGAHNELIPALLDALRQAKGGDIPVIVGGIIPQEDIPHLKEEGVREVFTPGTPIQTVLNAFRKAAGEHRQNKHITS